MNEQKTAPMTHAEQQAFIQAAMRQQWDPKTWPFRVTFYAYTGGYSGRYVSHAYTFATLAEAQEFIPIAAAHQPRGAKADIDRADEGPRGWQKSGRWVHVTPKK